MKAFNQWWLNQWRAFTTSLRALFLKNPVSHVITLLMLSAAITVPVLFYVIINNLENLSTTWQGTPVITLYLNNNVGDDAANQLVAQLQRWPNVQKVQYISPDQGLADFEQATQSYQLSDVLKQNPLPAVVVVTPAASQNTPTALQGLLNQLKAQSTVNQAQIDMSWVTRLYQIVNLGWHVTQVFIALFGIGLVLIISYTVRLVLAKQQPEVALYSLLGATRRYIRRPLLYRGMILGIVAALLAWAFSDAIIEWLAGSAAPLFSTLGGYRLEGLTLQDGLIMLACAGLLGWLGAFAAVRQALKLN